MSDHPWQEAPDVEWSCVQFQGMPMLVVQADGPMLSSSLLGRKYEKVDVRITMDTDKLPEMVEDRFIVFADGNIHEPFLVCDPDPMLMPIRVAVTKRWPWLLHLQVMVEGKKMQQTFMVNPDGTTESIAKPPLYANWTVVIG